MIKRGLSMLAVVLPLAGALVPMSAVRDVAAAETIHVVDPSDASPADCAPGHTDPCTLRAAVMRANGLTGTIIQLDALTYHLTIPRNGTDTTGFSGDLEVNAPMTIVGAGAGLTTIKADNDPGTGAAPLPTNNDRVLEVQDTGNLAISDLTIRGGRPPAVGEGESDGGGILNDSGTLAVNRVIFTDNRTARDDNVGVAGGGGGLASVGIGHVTVTNSSFLSNYAEGDGGGIYNETNTRTGADTFSHLWLDHNQSNGFQNQNPDNGGGAIYNAICTGNTAHFSDIMATHNDALRMSGGGIYENSCQNAQTTVTYDRLTLSQNSAFAQGGGFYIFDGTTTVTNSTITDNTIPLVQQDGIGIPEDGGGVAVGGPLATLTLNNDTISFNTSISGQAGGIFLGRSQDVLHLHNNIIQGNTGLAGASRNCMYTSGATVDSQGHNLANDTTCNLTGTGDRQGSQYNPNLGVLADNGGPRDGAPTADSATLTRALPSGSIAINTADNTNCPATDERGITRPQQATCDVGAYEFVFAVVASPSPSPTPALPKAGVSAGGPGAATSVFAALLILALAGAPLALLRRRRGVS